jgi:hypothetical protein
MDGERGRLQGPAVYACATLERQEGREGHGDEAQAEAKSPLIRGFFTGSRKSRKPY